MNSSPCVCGGKFSLYALGMILSVRRRFAVAAGEVVSDCKSLLSSQFFGCFAHCLSLWQISAPSGTWLVSCTSAQSMAGPCQQIRTASVLLACVAFGGGAPWWCQNRHTAHAAPRPPAQLAHPRQTRWPSGGGAALVAPIFSRGHRMGWSVE